MSIDRISINNREIDNQRQLDRVQDKAASNGVKSTEQSSPGEDSVVLSSRAMEIDRIAHMVQQVSDPRAERMEQVRKSLEAGTYRVSGREIARKLIDGHKK